MSKFILAALIILAVQWANADDIQYASRLAAAIAAGNAAGQVAYLPYRQPIADAWENPAEVGALAGVAYPKVAAAASRAACLVLAINPVICDQPEYSLPPYVFGLGAPAAAVTGTP